MGMVSDRDHELFGGDLIFFSNWFTLVLSYDFIEKILPFIPSRSNATSSTNPISNNPSLQRPLQTPSKASNLIAFFERGASGIPPSITNNPIGGLGVQSGHSRTTSAPTGSLSGGTKLKAPTAWSTLPTTTKTTDPLASTTALQAGGITPPRSVSRSGSLLGSMKKRSPSPMQGVRNIVAAWRGKTLSSTSPLGGMKSHDSGGNGPTHNKLEEAIFSIRRMSTRRKRKETGAVGMEKVGEGHLPTVGSVIMAMLPGGQTSYGGQGGCGGGGETSTVPESGGPAQAGGDGGQGSGPSGNSGYPGVGGDETRRGEAKGRVVSTITDIIDDVSDGVDVRLGWAILTAFFLTGKTAPSNRRPLVP